MVIEFSYLKHIYINFKIIIKKIKKILKNDKKYYKIS